MSTTAPASSVRTGSLGSACPACGKSISATEQRCPYCDFTGADVMPLFGEMVPPLLPVLDVADVWKPAEVDAILKATAALAKTYPQIQWRFCAVSLPRESKLPLFAFWLLNAAPLAKEETAETRTWTILLTIDVATGTANATSGYAVERWITPRDWRKILAQASEDWRGGSSADFAISFLKTSGSFLADAWQSTNRTRKRKP